MPNQLLGVLPHTIAISGLSRLRTELPHLLVIPSLAANRRAMATPVPDASPGEKYLRLHSGSLRTVTWAASTNKKHNSELPLFRDMSQSSPLPAGLLQRHQCQIARDLLATLWGTVPVRRHTVLPPSGGVRKRFIEYSPRAACLITVASSAT